MQLTNQHRFYDPFTGFILSTGWMLYVMFAPIYVFESGLPQPADFIILLTSSLAVVVFVLRNNLAFNRVVTSLLLMVALFFVINLVNFQYYRDIRFFYASVYYIFNGLAFGATVLLFKNNADNMMDKARWAVLFSLLLQVLWMVLFDSKTDFRETGSFNNPNQLGYWALLSSCYLVVLNYGRRMPWIDILGMLICTYIIAESLSRATMFSYVLILIVLFAGQYLNIVMKMGLVVLFTSYAFVQIAVLNNAEFLVQNFDKVERVIERLESAQTEDGVIEERGYHRLLSHPEYMIYGAGEGAYWRFSGAHSGLEIHSGLAAILMSYGVLGFVLFSIFVLTIFQRVPLLLWLTLAAVMAYGITHQHVRFTGFWVYLGLVYAMSRYVFVRQKEMFNRHQEQVSSRPLL